MPSAVTRSAILRRAGAIVTAAVMATAVTACSGPATEESPDQYPSQELDWTIAFGPGGGNDIMSRKIVEILQGKQMYPQDIVIENREGGSGSTGWGHVFSEAGSGYVISTTSGSFITTPLQADTGWQPQDFTPVGLVATDDAVFLLPGTSPVTDWAGWVELAKSKGTAVVGGIGTVNVDFIVHSMLAEQAGYEIDYVPFNDEGQLQTALLSGALDASVSNPAEVLGQVEAGEMRPLLVTAEQPLSALPGVPTDTSLGFTGIPSMPRGLILPPDAPEHAQRWWIAVMQQVVQTPEWKDYIEQNHLSEDLRWGPEFSTYLEQTQREFRRILTEQGAL
jgi:putative tricarboxylic transport membrane protein